MVTPRIGCSGWNYAAWRGHFYSADLPASQWLERYASSFDTVEVNNTFYRLPEASTFAAWRCQTPSRFVMAVKASRYLTHLKRLKEPVEPVARLFARCSHLGSKLGPVLYQLPGNFHRDLERLESFLQALPQRLQLNGVRRPRSIRHVIEFRHPSWYVTETFALLESYGVTLCLHDKLGAAITEPIVGPIFYVRFHGTSGHYAGSYDTRTLASWAARIVEQMKEGRPVYAYFNNDPNAVATENAMTLKQLVQRMSSRSG